jgi:hypothetical protein
MKYLLLAILSVSCSDGFMGKLDSYGASRSITCYSGGKLIYSGESTGKIQSEANSDGYYFVEKGTKKLVEVSGNCVIGK